MKACFECKAPLLAGHRYCDCRRAPLCNECFGPHTDECPSYGDGEGICGDSDGDLGLEDDLEEDGGEA